MRLDFRTLSKAVSTFTVLCVLFLGLGLDVSAQHRGRNWGRGHSRGRHLGWERGRRTGQWRRHSNDRRRWRRSMRRDRRDDRRSWRRHRRSDRRSSWDNNRNLRTTRYRQSAYWRNRY